MVISLGKKEGNQSKGSLSVEQTLKTCSLYIWPVYTPGHKNIWKNSKTSPFHIIFILYLSFQRPFWTFPSGIPTSQPPGGKSWVTSKKWLCSNSRAIGSQTFISTLRWSILLSAIIRHTDNTTVLRRDGLNKSLKSSIYLGKVCWWHQ